MTYTLPSFRSRPRRRAQARARHGLTPFGDGQDRKHSQMIRGRGRRTTRGSYLGNTPFNAGKPSNQETSIPLRDGGIIGQPSRQEASEEPSSESRVY